MSQLAVRESIGGVSGWRSNPAVDRVVQHVLRQLRGPRSRNFEKRCIRFEEGLDHEVFIRDYMHASDAGPRGGKMVRIIYLA
jgi:hypothetical protein